MLRILAEKAETIQSGKKCTDSAFTRSQKWLESATQQVESKDIHPKESDEFSSEYNLSLLF